LSRISAVIREAKKMVLPSTSEEARMGSIARVLLSRTRRAARRFPETRGVLMGGSFAKGTWLPRHVDLDVFVKIDPAVTDDQFERIGLEIGAIATRGYPAGKKYAQHPYTEAKIEGARVNVVPCFAVEKGEWKSAADRSPFHVKLVERLPNEKKNEVRLLKLFMNGVGVYGAEIQRQGFSGYVAEVLVMKLGDFESVLDWFSKYVPPSNARIFSLPDPVDEGRDLGIAVSAESLGRMVLASREFLKRPRLPFFRKMTGRTNRALRDRVYAVSFTHTKLSEDTLWGELRRTTKHVVRHLEVQGFTIARSMAASDNTRRSAILLIPEYTELPVMEQRVGPTVDRRKDVNAFLSSNSRDSQLVWIDGDARIRILRPRRQTRVVELLKDVARGKGEPIGASRELEAGMKKTAKVLQGASLAKAAMGAKWLRDGITEITSDALGTR